MYGFDVKKNKVDMGGNNLGFSQIAIRTYSSESMRWVAPSDGYLKISTLSYGNSKCTAHVSGAVPSGAGTIQLQCEGNGISGQNLLFVRKGMKVYFTITGTGASAYFYGFTE